MTVHFFLLVPVLPKAISYHLLPMALPKLLRDLEDASLEQAGSPPLTYWGEMDRLCGRLIVPLSIMGLVVWLAYIPMDRAVHPELPQIVWFRAGLTVMSILTLMFRKLFRPGILLGINWAYLCLATGVLTGLTGGDAVYVGGFLFVLVLAPVVPLPRIFTWAVLLASVAAFIYVGIPPGLTAATPHARYSLTDLAMATAVSGLLIFLLDGARRRSWRQSLLIEQQRLRLEADNARIDSLLLNMLPRTIADELKDKGYVTPRLYPSVTVVFTDFTGFTNIAEKTTPQELIHDLDKCFSFFDLIMDRHNLEKLKTIGDGYMFAGGIPRSSCTHAVDAVLASLEIVRFMEELRQERKQQGRPFWRLRLGINTGPLTAGVVGQKKFAYDVWGDTVNVASRMESSGREGRANISAATERLVREFFVTESRGQVPVKNKGVVEMFFVVGLRPELTAGGLGIEPNEQFRAKYEKLAHLVQPKSEPFTAS